MFHPSQGAPESARLALALLPRSRWPGKSFLIRATLSLRAARPCSNMWPSSWDACAVSHFWPTGASAAASGRTCRELDWDYIIGITNNTIITFPGGVQRPVDQLGVKKGE